MTSKDMETENMPVLASLGTDTNLEVKLQDFFLSVNAEKIKEFYAIAYRFYKEKRHEEAISLFRTLVIVDPTKVKHWKGLGASLQMTKAYHQALYAYECAQALPQGETDPYLDIYMADCHFAIGQIKNGLQALKSAKNKANQNPHIIHHANLMRELWSGK